MANFTNSTSPNNITGSSCPTSATPVDLEIPKNLTYAVIPGYNASDRWMAECCLPFPVDIVRDCWEWCQVPETEMIDNKTHHRTADEISDSFGACLTMNHRDIRKSNGLLIHMSGAVTHSRVSFAGMALTVLAASFLFV